MLLPDRRLNKNHDPDFYLALWQGLQKQSTKIGSWTFVRTQRQRAPSWYKRGSIRSILKEKMDKTWSFMKARAFHSLENRKSITIPDQFQTRISYSSYKLKLTVQILESHEMTKQEKIKWWIDKGFLPMNGCIVRKVNQSRFVPHGLCGNHQ